MDSLLGLLRIRVIRGVNLAFRDARGSDPYIVIRLGRQVRLFFFFFLGARGGMGVKSVTVIKPCVFGRWLVRWTEDCEGKLDRWLRVFCFLRSGQVDGVRGCAVTDHNSPVGH